MRPTSRSKYKAVQVFPSVGRKIEIEWIASFSVIWFLELELLWVLESEVGSNMLSISYSLLP